MNPPFPARREPPSLLPDRLYTPHLCSSASALAWARTDRRDARRWRHGRGVSGAGHDAQSRRGHQGAASGVRERLGAPRSLHARGADASRAQSPQHRAHSRPRGIRRRACARDGAGRGGGSVAAHRAWRNSHRRRATHRATGRRGAGGGARPGDRPPRSETREHHGAARRHREGPRLRARQGDRASRPPPRISPTPRPSPAPP